MQNKVAAAFAQSQCVNLGRDPGKEAMTKRWGECAAPCVPGVWWEYREVGGMQLMDSLSHA